MKRGLPVLLSMILLAALLTGCVKENTENQSTEKQKKKVLTIMLNGISANAYIEGTQKIIDAFNAENEYGIKIESDFVSTNDYKAKLTTMMATDTQPDIIYTWELGYLENFVNGRKIVNLQEYLDEDPQWKKSFHNGTLEQVTYNGDVYGIPTAQCMTVMYYNKEIFKKYNLEIPKTYEEYCQICDILLQNGVTPAALAVTPEDSWLVSQYIQQLSNGIGGYDLFEGVKKGTADWNDPEIAEVARLFQKEIEKGYYEEGFMDVDGLEAKILFQTGKTAMFFTGTWENSDFSNPQVCQEAGNIGCFAMPALYGENNNISVGSLDNCYAITTNCKDIEGAVEFLKFLTNEENSAKLLYEYGRMPAVSIKPDWEKLSTLSREALRLFEEQKNLTPWFDRVDTDLGNQFNNACLSIAEGGDVQEILDAIQEEAKARVTGGM